MSKKQGYLFLLFWSISLTGLAQNKSTIAPNVQRAHSSKIEFFDSWVEKHLLLTASASEVILWNTQTGLQLRTIASPYPIKGVSFASGGAEIAVLMYEYKKDASLRFYNAKNGSALDTIAYYTNNIYNGIYYKSLDLLVRNESGDRLLVKAFNEVFVVNALNKAKISEFKVNTFETQFAFCQNNESLFRVMRDGDTKIDVVNYKGETVKEGTPVKEQIRSIANFGNLLYLLSESGEIVILNKDLAVTDKIVTGVEIAKYSPPKITISSDGKMIVVPINNTLTVYDLVQKKWNTKPLKIYEKVVAITANASELAVMSNTTNFVQTNSGNKILEQDVVLSSLGGLSFNPSGTVLMSGRNSTFSAFSKGIDLQTGAQLKEDFSIKQWITDSLILCIANNNLPSGSTSYEAQIRNFYDGKVKFSFSKKDVVISDAKIAPNKKCIALLSRDHATLFILSGNNYAAVKTVGVKSKNTIEVIFSPNSQFICVTGEQHVSVYDLAQNQWINGKDEVGGYGIVDLAFTKDSKSIIYSYSNFGEKSIALSEVGSMVKQMDLATGNAIKMFDYDNGLGDIIFHPTENIYALAYLNGVVEVRNGVDNAVIFKQLLHAGFATEVLFSPKKNWLISLGWDNQLVITDYTNGKQIAKAVNIYSAGSAGISVFTPENYYMVPATNVAGLHYVEDFNTYSFKQFDYRFNRPDKVLQKLGSQDTSLINSYKKAYEKRLRKLGIDTTSFTNKYAVPRADFSNRELIAFEQKENNLVVKVKGSDENTALDRLNIWVNEVPIYGIRGLNLKRNKRLQIDTSISLLLSAGNNKIETSIINAAGIESYRMPLLVNYAPVNLPKSKMHFVGIGINNFAESGHNLQWSVKDIRDLALKLKEKYTDEIEIDTLFDDQVTSQNVLALKGKLKNSQVDDKVIIAYSGHGLLNTNYDYFLSTYNIDFSKPEKNGLAYDSFEDLVDDIPARQKLMLIDACHSGEVDKEELLKLNESKEKLVSNGVQGAPVGDKDQTSKGVKITNLSKDSKLGMKNSFELMQDLFANIGKGTGSTIISAAGGMQFALEKNSLKNGVFTYSILEYMKETRSTGIKDLKDRVNKRVIELTDGLQQPTSRSENNVIDWRVW